MKRSILIVALTISMVWCCSPKEKASTLDKDLIGQWRNVYLKVSVNANAGVDSVKITECDSSNWETMLKIKPIRTFFNEDGSYKSEYYTLKDSLFMTSSGKWKVSGDTLIMESSNPKAAVIKLKTGIEGSLATFEGMLDFDSDGSTDDHYVGRQRRQ